LHTTLHHEMGALVEGLKTKVREAEDFDDTDVTATAAADAAEIALENVIRDSDAELAKLDRADPTLNSQRAVFPEGFGQVIDPESCEEQRAQPDDPEHGGSDQQDLSRRLHGPSVGPVGQGASSSTP
jgi:hypothetical protein